MYFLSMTVICLSPSGSVKLEGRNVDNAGHEQYRARTVLIRQKERHIARHGQALEWREGTGHASMSMKDGSVEVRERRRWRRCIR